MSRSVPWPDRSPFIMCSPNIVVKALSKEAARQGLAIMMLRGSNSRSPGQLNLSQSPGQVNPSQSTGQLNPRQSTGQRL